VPTGRGERAARGATYIQHNPGVGDGKQAFIDYFARMAEEYPGTRVEFLSGDCRGRLRGAALLQHWPGDHDNAGMDIFRFDSDGKVVAHWDVLQVVPERSDNDNTMF
jgi:predicted SnoaL-like aldol condensation-catalyzing enzyme